MSDDLGKGPEAAHTLCQGFTVNDNCMGIAAHLKAPYLVHLRGILHRVYSDTIRTSWKVDMQASLRLSICRYTHNVDYR